MHTDASPSTAHGASLEAWLAPLRGRWRLLVAVPLVAGALGIAGSFLIKPVFSATTTFLPPQQQQSSAASALASLGALASLAGGGGIKSPAEQYVAMMQSVKVSDRLIDQFDLMKVYGATLRQDARQSLLEHAQITLGKKDGFIVVTVEDHDPERAAAIANQYVTELRLMTSVLAVTEAQQRRVFFEKQLQEVKLKLGEAQRALQGSSFTLGDLKSEPKAAAEGYAKLRAELTTAEVQLQTLQNAMAPGAPEVQRQSALIQALRTKLADAEQRGGKGGLASPDYVNRYREFKYQETLFDLFARQYELARVDESREGALIQVIDVATPGEHKVRPKRSLFGLNAALGAELVTMLWLIRRSRREPART